MHHHFHSWLKESLRRGLTLGAAGWLGFILYLAALTPLSVPAQPAVNSDIVADPTESSDNPTNGLGSWIWAATTYDRQTCQLWRSFEIPAGTAVTSARVSVTADNENTFFFDGRELGRGADWHNLYEYNLTMLMTPGRHVLAVVAFNSEDYAGLIFGMQVHLADGRVVEVKSDSTWRIVPDGARGWEKMTGAPDSWPSATIIAPMGSLPWWEKPGNIVFIPPALPITTYFWQSSVFQITIIIICGLVILISLGLMAQLALHQQERWLLLQERARIARDIHDDLGSRMTQLVLHGEVAQSELPAESVTRSQLHGICEEARGLLSSMDEILWAVNPRRDTLRDFTSYVCGFAQAFFDRTTIQCLFDIDPDMSAAKLDLPLRRSLLMAIKEALTNILKHSEASTVKIQIRWQRQKLVVIVKDDGRGFTPSKANSERNGLINMADRLKELGGSCVITSQPAQGCQVEFSIPLSQWRRRPWNWIWKARVLSTAIDETKNPRATNNSQIHDPANC